MGQTVALPEEETFLREETGEISILELEGKACRAYCESGKIMYSNQVFQVRSMAELAS